MTHNPFVILANGNFPKHSIPVDILKNAKSLCDKLIVGVSTDELVTRCSTHNCGFIWLKKNLNRSIFTVVNFSIC